MEALFVDYLVPLTVWLVPIAAVLAILGSVLKMAMTPKAALQTLIGVAVLVVIFFIGYSMSSDAVTSKQMTEFNVDAETSKFIGGALRMLYALFILVIVAGVWKAVSKLFK
ncbi:hypothetical protein V6R21_12415 [Limibacter armeniacum]|uniref:hypothetical protein n=1 Tax=Limibacter armeniacum TaxID=466084 RepID=UPI002FE66E03